MFGLKPEETSAIAAIAQTVLAFIGIVASVAVALFVYFGTKRIAKAQFVQTLSAAWIAYDSAILADERNVRLMNAILERQQPEVADLPRKRWLGYLLLNPFAITHNGVERGLLEPELLDKVRSGLAAWLQDPDIFRLTQVGIYPPSFAQFCHELVAQPGAKV